MLFLIISENIGWKLTILFFSLAAKTKKNQSNQPRWRKPSSIQFFSFNFFLVLRHFSLKQKITELIFVRLKILLRRRWWSASSFASAVGCGSTTTTTTMKTTTRSSGSAASAAGKACACPERWGEHLNLLPIFVKERMSPVTKQCQRKRAKIYEILSWKQLPR